LIEDIAAALGTVGHVAALRRLAVMPFADQPMYALERLEEVAQHGGLDALDAVLLPPDLALPDWPAIEVGTAVADRLVQGQTVPAEPAWPSGAVRVYAEQRRFIALGTVTAEGRLAPDRVFRR
jgi:tRNA pseudouridine55 synthase